MNSSDLKIYLSGGSSNTDPLQSYGGVISSTLAFDVSVSPDPLMSGASYVDAGGMPNGVGVLEFNPTYSSFYLRPPGMPVGPSTRVQGDGIYRVMSGYGASKAYMLLDVTEASLPTSATNTEFTVTNNAAELFDDVEAQESYYGKVAFRAIYLKNTHSTESIVDIGVYMDAQTVGEDTIHVGFDTAGVGDGSSTGVATQLADEFDSTNQIAGVQFVYSTEPENAVFLGDTLAPGESVALWVKRVVPQNVTTAVTANTYSIGILMQLNG